MQVHHSVLRLVESWQKAIGADFAQQYPEDSPNQSQRVVLHLITIVLGLYLCEERGLIASGQLQILREKDKPYQELLQLWQTLCRLGNPFTRFGLPSELILSERLLREMIDSLYVARPEHDVKLPLEILGQVYENILARSETPVSKLTVTPSRKTGGVYYTPQPIAQHMVKTTIDRAAALPYLPQILDPACGGGAFLMEAFQYLLDRQRTWYLDTDPDRLRPDKAGQLQLRFADRQRLLRCVYGVDIDFNSVAITQLSLCLRLLENTDLSEGMYSTVFLDIRSNICWGNALVGLKPDLLNDPNGVELEKVEGQFSSWQAAFPQIFAAGGFDLVIGNPPYVDAETMTTHLPHWRSYCAVHYQTATGNWDLFCVFIEKALQLCRPGGLTSLIVPNKLLSAHYASTARLLLCQTSQIISIRDYSHVPVFAALVYPLVYLAQKKIGSCSNCLSSSTGAEPIQYEQMQTIDQVGQTYPLSLQALTAAQPWLIGVSVQTELMQRLDLLPKLGELVQVTGAATVSEAYLLKALIRDDPNPNSADLRIVNSGTIDRYCWLWGSKPLRYLGQAYRYPVIAQVDFPRLPGKRLTQAKQPKIIVAGMSQRLECGLDPTGEILAGKSTSIVQIRSAQTRPTQIPTAQIWQTQSEPVEMPLDLRYWLGILNSRLISFYFLSRFSGNRLQGGYVRVGPPQLRDLPVVIPNLNSDQKTKYGQLLERVDCLQQLAALLSLKRSAIGQLSSEMQNHQELSQIQSEIQKNDTEIDAIVYELYQLSDKEVTAIEQWT